VAILKTISGIRGTIGGKQDEGLTPFDVVKFATAYAFWLKESGSSQAIVIGRDARISGEMVNHLVVGALMGAGFDVIDLGLSTTPTVEMAVTDFKASGGIILTASQDAVNSSGGIFVPLLLKALGVKDIIELNCEPTGLFAHNPEPLPENLASLSNLVKRDGCCRLYFTA